MKIKTEKDYLLEMSPGCPVITRLARLLSTEGLSSPSDAASLRRAISTFTDGEFEEACNGATKADAARFLEQRELGSMWKWGAPELVKAIVLSSERDEAIAVRAVGIAQSMKELPDIFSPEEGILWARARGYIISSYICDWCGVPFGFTSSPSLPLSEAAASAAKVTTLPETSQNDDNEPWLNVNEKDPAPILPWYTPARYFARQLIKDDSTLLTKRKLLGEKVATSLAGVGIFKRGNTKKKFIGDTVLKAFSNVSF